MQQNSSKPIPLFERLEIESQSNCNRDCWFCSRTHDRSGIYKDEHGQSVIKEMPTEKILDILNQAQVLGFTGEISFHFYSEPLLDPRNLILAREAIKRGMLTRLNTNGDVLENNKQLWAELRDIYDIIVVGIYDYSSQEELEECKRIWRDRLPGDNIKFSPIKNGGERSLYSLGVPRALSPKDDRFRGPTITFPNATCRRPLIRMLVRYDGEMMLCCDDLKGDFKLGNIYKQSLETLWYSDKHAKIIHDLIAGRREKYSLCAICPQIPSGPLPSGERIKIVPRPF
jgi:radical SAM protein with 4Fe4S-binding SPASM domain